MQIVINFTHSLPKEEKVMHSAWNLLCIANGRMCKSGAKKEENNY